jgi:hypothetical protein
VSMNIFERAARAKLRFRASGSVLAVEDLFDLPLSATGSRLSLDRIARDTHSQLKTFDEVSFVDTKPNPEKVTLDLQMDIIKHVIESKKLDFAAAAARVEKMELRKKLAEKLAQKRDQKLDQMSEEDILKQLNDLDAKDAPVATS